MIELEHPLTRAGLGRLEYKSTLPVCPGNPLELLADADRPRLKIGHVAGQPQQLPLPHPEIDGEPVQRVPAVPAHGSEQGRHLLKVERGNRWCPNRGQLDLIGNVAYNITLTDRHGKCLVQPGMRIAHRLRRKLLVQLIHPGLYIHRSELIQLFPADRGLTNVAPDNTLVVTPNIRLQVDREDLEPGRTPRGERWLGHRQIDPLRVRSLKLFELFTRLTLCGCAASNSPSVFQVHLCHPSARSLGILVDGAFPVRASFASCHLNTDSWPDRLANHPSQCGVICRDRLRRFRHA
ncbi:MAG: hypothetical protein WCI67_07210 [Chloroflexales bacterium]